VGILDTSTPNYHSKNNAYIDIYEEYVTEAAFLWVLRSISVNEPHNDRENILTLERRIEAQLDGLMTSLNLGWQVCEEALELLEPGEVFTAMVVAMRSHDSTKIKIAVDAGLSSKYAMKGLVSAMGWLSADIADTWIDRFLNGKDMQHKYLGIAACSVRRTDPGDALISILKRDDCIHDVQLHSRSLRLIGELRRQDCMPFINNAIASDDEVIRFWANWSAVLLGQHASVDNLKSYILKSSSFQDKAIQLVFRVLDVNKGRDWISELSKDKKQIRAVIKALGILGDPHAVNWLINKMNDPLYAKLAGESFAYITGIDFVKSDLSIDAPDIYPSIPNDNLDDDIIGLDEDENLTYPNVEKVASIWQKYGQKFIVGKRYFFGQPITVKHLNDKVKNGMQRQKYAASLELALHENGAPISNIQAKVFNI